MFCPILSPPLRCSFSCFVQYCTFLLRAGHFSSSSLSLLARVSLLRLSSPFLSSVHLYLNRTVLLISLTQTLILIPCLYLQAKEIDTSSLCPEDDFVCQMNAFWTAPFLPNLLNSTVFLVETSQMIAVFFTNYKG